MIRKCRRLSLNLLRKLPKEKEEEVVPLVVTYHPSLNSLNKIIRDNLYLLYMNDDVKKKCKRWNNYKNKARKFLRGESCIQQNLFENYQSSGYTGFIEDVCKTLIDKIDPFIPTKREDYWRQT